jgi:hypothetical protein
MSVRRRVGKYVLTQNETRITARMLATLTAGRFNGDFDMFMLTTYELRP